MTDPPPPALMILAVVMALTLLGAVTAVMMWIARRLG